MGGIQALHRICHSHAYNRHFRSPDVLSQIMGVARVFAFNRRIKIPLRSIFSIVAIDVRRAQVVMRFSYAINAAGRCWFRLIEASVLQKQFKAPPSRGGVQPKTECASSRDIWQPSGGQYRHRRPSAAQRSRHLKELRRDLRGRSFA